MGSGMSELNKIQAKTAAEVCGKYEQAAEILPLLSEGWRWRFGSIRERPETSM